MPIPGNKFYFPILFFCLLGVPGWPTPLAAALEPITIYHLRYDQIFLNNVLVKDNLVMVPVSKPPGRENFSPISITGVITMTVMESKIDLAARAKTGAFKKLLVNRGLKSLRSTNHQTIVSYEGLVNTPVNLIGKHDVDAGLFHYRAAIDFYSLPFPGQPRRISPKAWIMEKFDDFF